MEEQIRNIVEQSLLIKAEILSENYDYITLDKFKCLPMAGDIIRYNYNKYEVIRREFELDNCYYSDVVETTCRIIVKILKEEEEK